MDGSAVSGERHWPVDWGPKTSGTARYSADRPPPGCLIARILRSPYPLARVRSIDTSRAEALSGVAAVITQADFGKGARYLHMGGDLSDRPYLADGLVRFVGQEVAAVAAVDAWTAEEALESIRVRYRPLRNAPFTIAEALDKRSYRLHERPGGKHNVSVQAAGEYGDAAAVSPSAVAVTATYRTQRQGHAPMEPNTTLAWWHPDEERLEVWTSTQAPEMIRREIAHALRLDLAQVVMRDVYVGGGFGSKSKISEHEVLAAALSVKAGAPVLLALSREEEFATTKPRHPFEIDLTVEATGAGELTAFRADVRVDNGAYNHYGPSVMGVGVHTLASIYRPAHLTWSATLVDTALPPGGQFRGYGAPQACFALESAIDDVAHALARDPIDLRIQNANPSGSTTLSGARIGSSGMAACLEVLRDELDWSRRRSELGPYRGLGVAVAAHGSGAYVLDDANRSECDVTITEDGEVTAFFGGIDAGTGQRSVIAALVAEQLGLSPHDVRVVMADSEATPFDLGAFGSRGTHFSGHAALKAASSMATHLREVAAERFGCPASEVVLDRGRVRCRGEQVDLGAIAAQSPRTVDGVLRAHGVYVDPHLSQLRSHDPVNISPSYAFAAHGVELEIDPDTGEVRIERYVAVHDIGRVIQPGLARGQVIGGVVQGLGFALSEELLHECGRAVNPTYLNYALPRLADRPIEAVLLEDFGDVGPTGAKNVGELSLVPVAAAVANALFHATGVRFRELPLTPDRVVRALRRSTSVRRPRLWRRPGRWQVEAFRRLYPIGLKAVLERGSQAAPPGDGRRAIRSLEEAVTLDELLAARSRGTRPLGGGTELVTDPRCTPADVVAVEGVPALRRLHVADDGLRIGAAVRLAEMEAAEAEVPRVLREATAGIASPQVRAQATVAGNLVQEKRCWFFRNGFNCYKRGGWTRPCYAVEGDHRFHHAVMGAHRCQAVTPSDLATALVALDAEVLLRSLARRRVVPVHAFFTGPGETVLADDEVITDVWVPGPHLDRDGVYEKLALWPGDFAVVSVAVTALDDAGRLVEPRVVLGGLAPTPWRARAVEARLDGAPRSILAVDDLVASLSADLTHRAHPLPGNAWKFDAACGVLRRALVRLLRAKV